MKKPEIDIKIGKDGKVEIHVRNSSGKACLKIADAVKEILGGELSRKKTTEYYDDGGEVQIDTRVKGSVSE